MTPLPSVARTPPPREGGPASIARRCLSESQPIPVWVDEMDLAAPGLHRDLTIEVTSDRIQVTDPQVHEAVRRGVASVL